MSKRKLLLADDSVTIQKVVNLTFADEGIEVISVGDGNSAMEKVAEISPDLIMADVNMPGLTGYEICEKIRHDDKLQRTPVILLVGSFEPFDEDEARRVGADDYLTKPFQSIRQLVNKVTILLNAQNENGGSNSEMKDSSSLEDTLEMDAGEISQNLGSTELTDTGFDDEMIQTNRPSSFAFDETLRFETKETAEVGESLDYQIQQNSTADHYQETETDFDSVEKFGTPETEYSSGYTATVKEPETDSYYVASGETYSAENVTDEVSYEIESKSEVSNQSFESSEVTEPIENSFDDAAITESKAEEEISNEFEISGESEISDESEIKEDVSEETPVYEIEEEEENTSFLEEPEEAVEESKGFAFISDESEKEENISPENEIHQTNDEAEKIDESLESETEDETEIPEVSNEVELVSNNQEEEIPLPDSASVLEFDDDDILQLPPLELEFEDDEEETVEPIVQPNTPAAPVQTSGFVSNQESNSTIESLQISPELIDLIVSKVLERLSEKAVKEVAWEVVPQMTELIVTKMAEEKLK